MKRLSSILFLAGCLLCLLSSPRAFAQTDEVLSCGDNSSGQIGDSTTTNRTLITPAFYISGIKAIACGYNHTLALDSTGTVWAWGYNGLGQLGTGDTIDRATPVPVFYGAKAIAAGAAHSLALDASGTVWAWGDNYSGELGTASGTNPYVPNPMVGLPLAIKAIACGGLHSLMLDQSGDLYGCGYNGYGQLGLADNTDRSTPTFIAQWVVAMSAGYAHTLIQTASNSLFAAGYNGDGELGDGTQTDRNTFVYCGINPRSFAAGHYHSLAVGVDGNAYAWGYNGYGELGMGDNNDRLSPTKMPGAANAKAVAGGELHTLVLESDGKVLATGYNGKGQLGDGTTTTRNQLVPVKNATFIGSIAAGSYYSVLIKPFTKSLATGYNNYGQLGIGSTVSQENKPVPMKIGGSIVAVSTGPSGWHSLLLRADGTVWACGDNQFGQLGNGTTTSSITPVQVRGPGGLGYLTNIIAIAAGNFHNMAMAADGSVYTWGRNSHGQLGTGDFIDRYTPVQVLGSGSVYTIAAGGYHSMVIMTIDDSMYDCGYNGYGQLGQGDTIDRSSFTSTPTQYMTGIVGGHFHSVLLASSGYQLGIMAPFGSNSNGQLGTGDTTNQYYPDYEYGTQVIAVAAGGFHTLAINAAGQVWETGYNYDGELGLGDNGDRWGWTLNPNVQATGIACGYLHSLFVDVYGGLYASGYGSYGQLGNGFTTDQFNPTYVSGAPYTTSMAGGWGHTLILTAPFIQVASMKVSPISVIGGANATGTLTLTGLAGAGGQQVYVWSDNSSVALPAYVTVAQTSKTATFTIKTPRVSAKTVAHIYAYLNNEVSATLTINP